MDKEWLKNAKIEELIEQLLIRHGTILRSEGRKDIFAFEDMKHHNDPHHVSGFKMLEEAQKSFEELKAEIARRVNETVPKKDVQKVLDMLVRMVECPKTSA